MLQLVIAIASLLFWCYSFFSSNLQQVQIVLPRQIYLHIKDTDYYQHVVNVLQFFNQHVVVIKLILLLICLVNVVLIVYYKKSQSFLICLILLFVNAGVIGHCLDGSVRLADFIFFQVEQFFSVQDKQIYFFNQIKQQVGLILQLTPEQKNNIINSIYQDTRDLDWKILGVYELEKYAHQVVQWYNPEVKIPCFSTPYSYCDWCIQVYYWGIQNPGSFFLLVVLLISVLLLLAYVLAKNI